MDASKRIEKNLEWGRMGAGHTNHLKVISNHVTELVTVFSKGSADETEISIYTPAGKKIVSQKFNRTFSWHSKNKSRGIYLIHVSSKNGYKHTFKYLKR